MFSSPSWGSRSLRFQISTHESHQASFELRILQRLGKDVSQLFICWNPDEACGGSEWRHVQNASRYQYVLHVHDHQWYDFPIRCMRCYPHTRVYRLLVVSPCFVSSCEDIWSQLQFQMLNGFSSWQCNRLLHSWSPQHDRFVVLCQQSCCRPTWLTVSPIGISKSIQSILVPTPITSLKLGLLFRYPITWCNAAQCDTPADVQKLANCDAAKEREIALFFWNFLR